MTNPFCLIKNAKSAAFGIIALSAMSLLAACGGEETPNAPIADSSSSPVVGPVATSSDAGAGVLPASSASVPVGGGEVVAPGAFVNPNAAVNPLVYVVDPTLAVTPDADGFYYIADIYKALPATSKVVFVIRHSERGKSEDQTSELTDHGIELAKALGADMASDEKFYYASTDFIRTRETCKHIAAGRGEGEVDVVTMPEINGTYFYTVSSDSLDKLLRNRGGSWLNVSLWAYGQPFQVKWLNNNAKTAFYDLYERGYQFVNEVVLANLANWNRVNILASHDLLLEPLTVYASNRTVDLKFYEETSRWINYMAGIAVVVNADGSVYLYPVRGTELGWMTQESSV